jgi:hypothetical protein
MSTILVAIRYDPHANKANRESQAQTPALHGGVYLNPAGLIQ